MFQNIFKRFKVLIATLICPLTWTITNHHIAPLAVNGSGESFQAMLKMAASEIRFRCELKHDAFKHATEESVQKLLKRIYAIVETKRLYKEIVGERCFVGVFGQEDAGKSTFIRVSDI